MSPPRQSKVDVLIIGAGPAGLMCAHALARARVNVRIVDKRAERLDTGHADGIQPRTVEVLQSYGFLDRFLKDGSQLIMCAFYDPDSEGGIQMSARGPDISPPSARYPFEIGLHQGAIEEIFADCMTPLGVEVERSTYPTNIEFSSDEAELVDPTSHPVKVTLERLEGPDGEPHEEIVHCKFVLGADGAHSWVRKALDISMDGERSDHIWGVLDMIPDTDFPDVRNKTFVRSNTGSCIFIPREGDMIRIYIQIADKDVLDPNTGRIDKERAGPDQLLEAVKQYIRPYSLNPTNGIDWWTLYIVGQRVASNFSIKNRAFIAGDACHTHSPKAGQGMNASMNDAHNLAWKLAFVLRGWADMSLLTTYESERRKYARDLIEFDRMWTGLVTKKPQTDGPDDGEGVSPEKLQEMYVTVGNFTSGIGVHYSPSVAVVDKYQSLAANLTIGERIPPQVFVRGADGRAFELQDLLPADVRFKVLVFTGDLDDALQQKRIDSLVKDLQQPESFFTRYASKDPSSSRFDIMTISKGKKETFNFMKVPSLLRSHWSKALIDDKDVKGLIGGQGYSYYGVGDEGAIVVVRPDGYVSAIAPLDGVAGISAYFAQFMKI